MNLDPKMLNVQELDSHEMTIHNGGGEIAEAIIRGVSALLAVAIVTTGIYSVVKFGVQAVSYGVKTIQSGIKTAYNYCQN